MDELLRDYSAEPGRADELLGSGATPRAAWQALLDGLGRLGEQGLRQRRRELRRLLVEHGHGTGARRWRLDPLPLVIDSREWRQIETGLAQRAELLRQVAHDLYGPQKLVARGLIPAEIAFGTGFLMPCHGIRIPLGQRLALYGADLVRLPDGRFHVAADHCRFPDGLAFAIEARSIVSRLLPSLYRDCGVHAVGPFLRRLRRILLDMADGDPGAAAVLGADPGDPLHAEHALLAHQLGLALVHATDIAVCGGCAGIDQEGGRRILRVLLRRVADICDPLELDHRSTRGIPGLLQSMREAQLSVVNPPGIGLLESPGIAALLPDLCRTLLGEELRLPSVPALWCGHPEAIAQVLDEPDAWRIQRLDDPRPVVHAPSEMSAAARRALLQAIRAAPRRYAARRVPRPATAPVLVGDRLQPRPVVIRAFALSAGEQFQVMSGGLARTLPDAGSLPMAKDVWILASEPVPRVEVLPSFPAMPAVSALQTLGVDQLFWFGRYAARIELLATLLSEAARAVLACDRPADDPECRALLAATSLQSTMLPGFVGADREARLADPAPELLRVLADPSDRNSLLGCAESLRRNADALRDLIGELLWRQCNQLCAELAGADSLADAHRLADRAQARAAALCAAPLRNLPRSTARDVILCGVLLESAVGIARLTRGLLVSPDVDPALGAALLLPLAGFAGTSADAPAAALATVLADADSPRALHRLLDSLHALIEALPRTADAARRIAAMADRVARQDATALLASPAKLDALLAELVECLHAASGPIEHAGDVWRRRPGSQLVQVA